MRKFNAEAAFNAISLRMRSCRNPSPPVFAFKDMFFQKGVFFCFARATQMFGNALIPRNTENLVFLKGWRAIFFSSALLAEFFRRVRAALKCCFFFSFTGFICMAIAPCDLLSGVKEATWQGQPRHNSCEEREEDHREHACYRPLKVLRAGPRSWLQRGITCKCMVLLVVGGQVWAQHLKSPEFYSKQRPWKTPTILNDSMFRLFHLRPLLPLVLLLYLSFFTPWSLDVRHHNDRCCTTPCQPKALVVLGVFKYLSPLNIAPHTCAPTRDLSW